MPEIPEIETIRTQLEQYATRKTITQIDVFRPKTLNVPPEQFVQTASNQTFTSVYRRAKLLALILSNHMSLVFHFMLEGYVRFYQSGETVAENAQLRILFSTGEQLAFYKMNLGFVHLVPTDIPAEIPEFQDLGPEPLSPEFTPAAFLTRIQKRKGMIKPLLMDQHVIAGIGNVYSNEILFCSRILPTRKTSSLQAEEKQQLYHCLRAILTQAIEKGGVNDTKFCQQDTITGGYEPYLKVAYRTGSPCPLCGQPIITRRIAGRNAFFCRNCQV